ncbi:hypothetical protein [Candidatus Magnetaquiglobus chichijimensis]
MDEHERRTIRPWERSTFAPWRRVNADWEGHRQPRPRGGRLWMHQAF